MIDRARLKTVLASRLNLPYGFGHKWDLHETDPRTAIDCSGFVRWGWAQAGVIVPEGSMNQWLASRALGPLEEIKLGDVGFFKKSDAPVHHVGLIYDEHFVIEARGAMISSATGIDIGNHVLLRPREKWEAWPEFKNAGGWRRLLAVDQADV